MNNNMSQSSVVGRTYPLGSCGARTPKGTKHKLASIQRRTRRLMGTKEEPFRNYGKSGAF